MSTTIQEYILSFSNPFKNRGSGRDLQFLKDNSYNIWSRSESLYNKNDYLIHDRGHKAFNL